MSVNLNFDAFLLCFPCRKAKAVNSSESKYGFEVCFMYYDDKHFCGGGGQEEGET